jgi:hypothetical protein
MTETTAPQITTAPFGVSSETVYLDGREIGDISVHGSGYASAKPAGAGRGFFRFADRADAIAACVSHDARGHWTNELSDMDVWIANNPQCRMGM